MLHGKSLIAAPVVLLALAANVAKADVPIYGQCGGIGYTGDTTCASGSVCTYQNDYYYQCLAGTALTTKTSTTTTKTSTTKTSTTSTKTTTTPTTTKTTTTTKATTTTTTGGSSGGCSSTMEGYATLNGGTTGGAGGSTVTVTNLADLRAAVAGTSPKIVRVATIIQGDGEVVDVGSNTSVLGACGGGLTGGGFRVKKGTNVIFRNLKLSKSPAPTDLIEIQASTNVWVDHNEFFSDLDHGKDYYDGATDINHGSDYITVSYNYYHDHYKTSLVGHSDNNGAEDSGHLHVTYHHNYFSNLGSRLPSLRFGTGHIYNNYYEDISISCIDSRDGAQTLIENNVFVNSQEVLMTNTYGGYANPVGNDWGGATPDLNPGTFTTPPYSRTLGATTGVVSAVKSCAGTCKITV
ncbi:hypothetical protein FS837_002743 [Tulasnella sp. UAMH 9824]|nr:hypothetical protein FS837_002743 [Tulasnella sp. UAMH 9824]